MFTPPHNSYAGIPTPQDNSISKWGSGRCLGHESETLQNRKDSRETPKPLLQCEGTKGGPWLRRQLSPYYAHTLKSDFQPPEPWGIRLSFISLSVCGISLQQAQRTRQAGCNTKWGEWYFSPSATGQNLDMLTVIWLISVTGDNHWGRMRKA